MKKFRQFNVGNVTIKKDGNNLEFCGTYHAQDPHHVVIAMLAVARYLKWNVSQEESYAAKVTRSKTGKTIYVNHEEVMHICSTGNTNWCRISKKQLRGAINDWYNNQNILIPPYAFDILPMLTVAKVEPYIEFEAEDYEQSDKLFLEFMESRCKAAGHYSFQNDEFRKGTGLPTAGLVWHYLTNRHEFTTFNGLYLSCASQKESTIEMTLR